MSGLPGSWWIWVGAALALFWFVGAYNRLMRLRSAALQAYATLDAALVRQLEFVLARSADDAPGAASEPLPSAALRGAAAQLATLLAATRLRPLRPAGIAALGTALHVLVVAWQRLHPDDAVIAFEADGTLSRPAPLSMSAREEPPDSVPIAWPEPSAAAEIARGQFNLAVAQYNASIQQFPALLVAWIMRLRPAAPLH